MYYVDGWMVVITTLLSSSTVYIRRAVKCCSKFKVVRS